MPDKSSSVEDILTAVVSHQLGLAGEREPTGILVQRASRNTRMSAVPAGLGWEHPWWRSGLLVTVVAMEITLLVMVVAMEITLLVMVVDMEITLLVMVVAIEIHLRVIVVG